MCDVGCYPNGALPVIALQFLLFCAWLLSLWAVGDCRFVTNGTNGSNLPDFVPGANFGLGFYIWEGANGDCAWDVANENIYEDYIDFLGDDWRAARGCGTAAGFMGLVLWIWSLFFICMSHNKCARYTMSAFNLICVILQGIVFMPLNSDFCDVAKCDFSRSAGLAIGAILCFFFCSILPCVMKDGDDDGPDNLPRDPYASSAAAAAAEPVGEVPKDDVEAGGGDQAKDSVEEQPISDAAPPQDSIAGTSTTASATPY